MSKDWTFKGKVWMFGEDINTDYMMPGFTPRGLSMDERTAYCMRAIRPQWSEQVEPGDIIMVPFKINKERTWLKNTASIAGIIASIATTAIIMDRL